MPEHTELSDDELDDIETYHEWHDGLLNCPGPECLVMRLLAEIRRLRDVERRKLRALVDDVIAYPERHPEIVVEARRRMGVPITPE